MDNLEKMKSVLLLKPQWCTMQNVKYVASYLQPQCIPLKYYAVTYLHPQSLKCAVLSLKPQWGTMENVKYAATYLQPQWLSIQNIKNASKYFYTQSVTVDNVLYATQYLSILNSQWGGTIANVAAMVLRPQFSSSKFPLGFSFIMPQWGNLNRFKMQIIILNVITVNIEMDK